MRQPCSSIVHCQRILKVSLGKHSVKLGSISRWTKGTCPQRNKCARPRDDAVPWPLPFRPDFDPSMLTSAYQHSAAECHCKSSPLLPSPATISKINKSLKVLLGFSRGVRSLRSRGGRRTKFLFARPQNCASRLDAAADAVLRRARECAARQLGIRGENVKRSVNTSNYKNELASRRFSGEDRYCSSQFPFLRGQR